MEEYIKLVKEIHSINNEEISDGTARWCAEFMNSIDFEILAECYKERPQWALKCLNNLMIGDY